MSTAEQIMRENQNLPEPFALEVLDFIEYIDSETCVQSPYSGGIHARTDTGNGPCLGNAEDAVWNDV